MSKLNNEGISAWVSSTDLNNVSCPHCGSTDTPVIGITYVEGVSNDTRHCQSCSHMFSKVQGGVAQYIDLVSGALNISSDLVGFTTTANTLPNTDISNLTMSTPYTTNGITIEPSGFYPLQQTYQNESSMIRSEIQNLNHALQNVLNELRNIVNENKNLQKQLATDPLIGMRDKINEFNLK